jgi:protein translocase SecG subunit
MKLQILNSIYAGIKIVITYLPLKKILFILIISLQTIMCLLLIFLILLQKGDDGGIGQVFMRTSILYNKSENIFVRKIIVFISVCVITSCLFLSVYFYKVNKTKYDIENIVQKPTFYIPDVIKK